MEDEEVAAFGVIYGFLTLAAWCVHVIMKKKKRKSCWVEPWIMQRPVNRAYTSIFNDLQHSDNISFRNFMRMDFAAFEELLSRVEFGISKKLSSLESQRMGFLFTAAIKADADTATFAIITDYGVLITTGANIDRHRACIIINHSLIIIPSCDWSDGKNTIVKYAENEHFNSRRILRSYFFEKIRSRASERRSDAGDQ
jgi:hypothetical protein